MKHELTKGKKKKKDKDCMLLNYYQKKNRVMY